MKIDVFNCLCQKISDGMGADKFKWDASLEEVAANTQSRPTAPLIAGEVKVALSVRMLAGGSYLDLVPLFDVSIASLCVVFGDFLDWVLQTLEFPLVRWIRDESWDVLNHLANQFAEKPNGVFFGPFAALDGLAIRIRSPTEKEVPDPGNYHCRKGFFALNVQAMCDRLKRFLWCYPSNKGSTHDSTAFAASRLYDLLIEEAISKVLHEMGLFIAGDSAYQLAPFLITPHDVLETKNDINGNKDSFNYHLSSCRIHIECAFGELVMRWGIFWRTLRFNLKKSIKIVQVCMLLHNHIIDSRHGQDSEDAAFFRNFTIQMDHVQTQLTQQHGEIPRAVAADNNEPDRGGRLSLEETKQRAIGMEIRERLTVKLATYRVKRPLQHDMHYNQHGNVYID